MSDAAKIPESFQGIARLFPLPDLVLFPHALQALHIFEPRYRQMTASALAGDRLIAVVLLRPGWEANYLGRPPLFRVACIGRITSNKKLPDGRYNLRLQGLARVRIVRELNTTDLYRSAEVKVLGDTKLPDADVEQGLRRRLTQVIPAWWPGKDDNARVLRRLIKSHIPMSALCDVLTFGLPFPVEWKQELLECCDVEKRARLLLRRLKSPVPSKAEAVPQKFPPDFSVN
jgi:Lon protease-like protein